MDPEVNQGMVMETTKVNMKMKTAMTLPNQASHRLNHTNYLAFKLHSFLFSDLNCMIELLEYDGDGVVRSCISRASS
jgi:hypothetical protein